MPQKTVYRVVMPMIRRGEVYAASLNPVVGSEQGGTRPVLIVQNDTGNRCSPTVIALALTSATGKPPLPTHVLVQADKSALSHDSLVLAEQIRTLDKRRLRGRIGRLDEETMRLVDCALRAALGLSANGP